MGEVKIVQEFDDGTVRVRWRGHTYVMPKGLVNAFCRGKEAGELPPYRRRSREKRPRVYSTGEAASRPRRHSDNPGA